LAKKERRLEAVRERLVAKEREVEALHGWLVGKEPFDLERIVWIFGAGRSGTTWLASMLGELGAFWNEPLVGALFGEFYEERNGRKRGYR
jgi:hypothetical protein